MNVHQLTSEATDWYVHKVEHCSAVKRETPYDMCNKDELRSQTQRLCSYLSDVMRSPYLYDILKKAKLGTKNRSVVARGGTEGGD